MQMNVGVFWLAMVRHSMVILILKDVGPRSVAAIEVCHENKIVYGILMAEGDT